MFSEPLHAYRGFLFLYFLFPFFTKIYFRYGNLQKYTPAARLPGGRDFNAKKRRKKIADRSLGPVARQRGGRLSHLYIRVGWSPHPSFASLQFQKQRKKEREGERRSPARFSSRRLQVTKILLRFTNSMIECPDMSSNYFCCNYFC